jgi:hypothetical protein
MAKKAEPVNKPKKQRDRTAWERKHERERSDTRLGYTTRGRG